MSDANKIDNILHQHTWVKRPGKTDNLPGWFPARIKMIDTGEIFTAKSMEDIPAGRTFKVLAVKVKEEKDA